MANETKQQAGQAAGSCSVEVTIPNVKGLHARASAKFVKCAERFDAQVTVTREGQSVPGTSILGLMMLAAAKGNTIVIEAAGPQAGDALKALTALVRKGFDEDN